MTITAGTGRNAQGGVYANSGSLPETDEENKPMDQLVFGPYKAGSTADVADVLPGERYLLRTGQVYWGGERFIDWIIDKVRHPKKSRRLQGISLEPGFKILSGYRTKELLANLEWYERGLMDNPKIIEKNPFVIADSELLYIDASEMPLPYFIFERDYMYATSFEGGNLTKTQWIDVIGRDVRFSYASMLCVIIRGTKQIVLGNDRENRQYTTVPSSQFISGKFDGTGLHHGKIYHTAMDYSYFTETTKLYRTVLNRVSLHRAFMDGVDFNDTFRIDTPLDEVVGDVAKKQSPAESVIMSLSHLGDAELDLLTAQVFGRNGKGGGKELKIPEIPDHVRSIRSPYGRNGTSKNGNERNGSVGLENLVRRSSPDLAFR